MNRISRRMKLSIATLVFVAFTAIAATVSINASSYPYNQVVAAQNMSAFDMAELRHAGLVGLAGMYRAAHGVASLPVGSRIKVTWGDGSVEEAAITCLTGSPCVLLLPGTQKPSSGGADGGQAGGGDSGDSGGSGGGMVGGGGCYGNCGIVGIGPISNPGNGGGGKPQEPPRIEDPE
ncbi:hypothetical protein [Stenotrophomonas sp. RAC2]|uniref:hypothetical protein n=1 Tax=Stenotrophomonas sp. RAC2 TaxID=3064902 RepID=UPI002725D553|nr:hypothetical protein [Stenotrophomonas sp. RAC2]MDV9043411.1 hypothetical protein [Stenotrophomonas sp. RAC2]